jgi:hypothetical protein
MPAPKPKKKGRPSKYSESVANAICEELANGRSLRSVCSSASMPTTSMVYRWLNEHPEFQEQYVRAREKQADYFADSVHDIAQFEEDVARARVRIDAIKWHASKLAPKRYGDRAHHTLAGDEDNPLKVEITDLELARRVTSLLRKAQ